MEKVAVMKANDVEFVLISHTLLQLDYGWGAVVGLHVSVAVSIIGCTQTFILLRLIKVL